MKKFPVKAFLLSYIAFELFLGSVIYVFFFGQIFQPVWLFGIGISGLVLSLFYSWIVKNKS